MSSVRPFIARNGNVACITKVICTSWASAQYCGGFFVTYHCCDIWQKTIGVILNCNLQKTKKKIVITNLQDYQKTKIVIIWKDGVHEDPVRTDPFKEWGCERTFTHVMWVR